MGEYISRQAAIDALNDLMLSTNVRKLDFEQIGYNHALADGILTIRRVPSAQRKGRWIPGKELSREFIGNTAVHIEYENFTCSSCGLTVKDLLYHVDGSSFYKFCPNCGAEMKGESDDERGSNWNYKW